MRAESLHRYPGLRPFERQQSPLFHGRKEDVQRLSYLIQRERLVVLFAKSGIGKTSLLQAGVAPDLEQQRFAPLFFRLDNPQKPIVEGVVSQLKTHALLSGIDDTGHLPGLEPTLWEWMKRLEFDLYGLPAIPVLIFDQFEEAFTLNHPEESLRAFLFQLADLANETMPADVRHVLLEKYRSTDASLSPLALQWWENQPDLRVVLSIRSDFLHLIDEISPIIPGILRNRYQLQPLSRRQAQQAIEAPAQAVEGGPYITPLFLYSEPAISDILDFLTHNNGANPTALSPSVLSGTELLPRKSQEVESISLQIVCSYIEEQILETGKTAGFVVEPTFYGNRSGLERELHEFYEKQLRLLPELYAKRTGNETLDPNSLIDTARRLIEESLVTPNDRRCSMVDDFLMSTWSVSQEFLDALVSSRLLRRDPRLEDYYYEISHDALLPAVLKSRALRRNKEQQNREKEALEEELAQEAELRRQEAAKRADAEERLKTATDKRRLARLVAIISFAAFLVTLLLGGIMLKNWVDSVHSALDQARHNRFTELHDAAVPAIDSLNQAPFKHWILSHTSPEADIAEERHIARQFQALFNSIHQVHLSAGDSLYFKQRYAEALDAYQTAKDSLNRYNNLNYYYHGKGFSPSWMIDTQRISAQYRAIGQRHESAIKTVISLFRVRQQNFETFFEAGLWGLAAYNADEMFALIPKRKEDVERLKKELHIDLSDDTSFESYVRDFQEMCRKKLAALE